MRICANCIYFAPAASVLLAPEAKRYPCEYPVPAYMAIFFTNAKQMLPTDGTGCAVHKLEGED